MRRATLGAKLKSVERIGTEGPERRTTLHSASVTSPHLAVVSGGIKFMGHEIFSKRSVHQLTRHIREVAKNTECVVISGHARIQMNRRRISVSEVLECLRNGSIHRQPEPNHIKGSLECRMERYVAGCECKVVVALDDDDPDLMHVSWIGHTSQRLSVAYGMCRWATSSAWRMRLEWKLGNC